MIGTLILTLLSSSAAWGQMNSMDGGTRGTCDAYLPSSTFLPSDLEVVEEVAVEVHHTLEVELGKMETYEIKITAYTARIVNLTGEVEKMEKAPEAFNEAHTESIKVQIKQVEALVMELQSSIHGSFAVFTSIRETVTSMISTLTRLEHNYDPNRVLEIRREYIKIQLQLEECERRHQEIFNPNIGSCAHTGIISVSKPIVSQINANLNAGVNFTSTNYEYRVIPRASTRFSYAHSPNQNFDFAADETGLWVTYASEASSGFLILAKINEPSFGIEEEWQTSVYKPGVSNAFMVCGVLYAVRTVDIQTEEIFYMFDTRTQQEHYISVPFERFQEGYANLDYNPTDQKLYIDDGRTDGQSLDDWGSGNVTVSVGDSGQILCHVYLPDTTFPASRVEHMQQVTKDLILEANIQITTIDSYMGKLVIFLSELQNLTGKVAILQSSLDNYIQLDFEILRIELREFEALVTQLKETLNVTSPMFDSLYDEIRNMTLIVNQLETYDRSNLEVIRIELAKLQKKLEDCQREQEDTNPEIGTCHHNGIVGLSKPTVIQLNANLNPSYQYGGWGKDSKPARGYESMYWYGGYTSPSVSDFYLYSDYDKLILRSSFKNIRLARGWISNGNNYIVHGNSIYYQHNTPFSMNKFNLTDSATGASRYTHRAIPDASQRFSYRYSPQQNLDFAADENGLWVIYASEESKGKLVVAKIDEPTFGIEEVWVTGAYKQQVGNAFMVCGVMYATRLVSLNTEEIFYSYDTESGQERQLSIPFVKFQEKYFNLDYNPSDQKLYMYNAGYYVSYNVKFN
ncbi:hypothetical protein NHX12_020161 [Muraenolepis orangiensis]|uniref:Olfactomedin-like domain-containing protein n=1 Tax=Muraenolepis orangiensis TaxID=630683 RepID=A0A9Q0IXU9_9TELE|nr:hypothetical protein NHX12_020161 [Muraenolepis orangiensis]